MDGLHGRDARVHMAEAQDPMNVQYEHHDLRHINNESDMVDEHTGRMNEGVEMGIPSRPGNLSDTRGDMVDHGGENGDQLTLSFQGQLYVFDSVSAEKLQATLRLLGGREIPQTASTTLGSSTTPQNNRCLSGTPQRSSVPQRLASLVRFREKRIGRNFDKKIRYSVRKEVALRMQRNKRQFTSAKSNDDDSASAGSSLGSNHSWGVERCGSQTREISCRHCGTSEKSTPMMRRGPKAEGPRTLCNACGLNWANKGTLRDLSKATQNMAKPPWPIEGTRVADSGDGTFGFNPGVSMNTAQCV
ncbi:PREDICTED: LOW QUALITY PROTEIN: GATA transcription factor 24 [Tarenaya hassleriana]|uniref:LOW QUALITY PROTEIN: GATA transcription factor 24 n=1 Tax=Tarenaya hassleriana TaxID=28532 RepID=UPI00053CA229|nr:PREDICTED: LOW QUALITY PROTEIN: GATA transcription factor 24 [Tarenaya hassleriana]